MAAAIGVELPSLDEARAETRAWLTSDDVAGEAVDHERLDLMIALNLRSE